MSKLKIIYDNAIDRATLAASSTAGVLVVDNLKIETKSKVWRSVGTTATISATWTVSEILSGVALPFTNLTSTATIRVRTYTDTAGTILFFDSGTMLAAPYVALGLWDWGTTPLGVNAYAYGGGTYGRCWFRPIGVGAVKKVVVDLIDTDNPSGYIEVSRFVTGAAWSPTFNTSYGLTVTPIDTSANSRTDGGDLITQNGIRSKSMNFDLSSMLASDKQKFSSIVRGNGKPKPLFISIFPDDNDSDKEQTYQIYGKLSDLGSLAMPNPLLYSSQISIEEI